MSGSNNSGSNTSKMAVPQAKEAMNRFKQEVASEIGVPLKEGYNGDLTSAQAGSIGGEMVKKKSRCQGSKKQLPASKKQLAARPKTAPHPWCDVKPFFLYNIHFTIFHSHGTQVPDGHALLSHHR